MKPRVSVLLLRFPFSVSTLVKVSSWHLGRSVLMDDAHRFLVDEGLVAIRQLRQVDVGRGGLRLPEVEGGPGAPGVSAVSSALAADANDRAAAAMSRGARENVRDFIADGYGFAQGAAAWPLGIHPASCRARVDNPHV